MFRMHRDDAYLRQMLGYVSRLWTEHALPPRAPPPPQNIWWKETEYQARGPPRCLGFLTRNFIICYNLCYDQCRV